jgi:hypothetical protein
MDDLIVVKLNGNSIADLDISRPGNSPFRVAKEFVKQLPKGCAIYFITLTYPQSTLTPEEGYQRLNKVRNLLIKAVREYSRRNEGDLLYFAVMEPHKKCGNPHLHLLIASGVEIGGRIKKLLYGFDFRGVKSKKKRGRLYFEGYRRKLGIGRSQVKKVKGKKVVGYITKYLTKWKEEWKAIKRKWKKGEYVRVAKMEVEGEGWKGRIERAIKARKPVRVWWWGGGIRRNSKSKRRPKKDQKGTGGVLLSPKIYPYLFIGELTSERLISLFKGGGLGWWGPPLKVNSKDEFVKIGGVIVSEV